MEQEISVIIYTRNEEDNIKECLTSAKLLTKKIIVIDSESTDKTIEIIKKEKIPVFQFSYSFYVEPTREFGINQAKTDWVFILDADERITPELAQEVKSAIRHSQFSHYKISRRNIFGNKWLKHGGWWPDYQIRLIDKKFFKGWPKEIHSSPVVFGKIGYLKQLLLHYFHGNLEEMVNKTIIFEDIESDLLYRAKKPVTTSTFFRKFLGELFRRLFKNFGFMDGTVGIIESIYQAFSKTITYLFLYEKYKKWSPCLPAGRSL